MRSNNYLLYISYTRQTFENLLVLIILHWKKVLHVVCAVTFFLFVSSKTKNGFDNIENLESHRIKLLSVQLVINQVQALNSL